MSMGGEYGPSARIRPFDLPEREQGLLLARGKAGDVEAAIRLALYYDFVRSDAEKAVLWYRTAAENGDVSSQYSLGVRLVARQDDASRQEGVRWLELAEKNGARLAGLALEKSRQRVRSA